MTEKKSSEAASAEVALQSEPSLSEALQKFEVANARVIDLTQRLISATNDADALQLQLDSFKVEHANFAQAHREITSSSSYRLADRIVQVRGLLRRP